MTLDGELAALRALARQMRGATRVDPRRLSAWASTLDGAVRALGGGIGHLRAEVERRPRSIDLSDPEPYRGLDLGQAAQLLGERVLTLGGWKLDERTDAQLLREVSAEAEALRQALLGDRWQAPPAPRPDPVAADPEANTPGRARTGAKRTSSGAALAVEPRTGTQRRRVLDAVAAVARDARTVGLTDVEVARSTGLPPNSARPRRKELVDGGWLEDSGVTRDHHGREHIVWVLSEKGMRLVAGLPAAS